MGKIIELDPLTINKIAAGEVIERPASVVKELVENSIDAGADSITIMVEEGGKKRIEVIDNGEGMSHEDAILAVKRHTTSKIRSAEDLFSIITLGFRGEALASIVSVAIVDIYTRTADEEIGTHLRVEGGKITIDEKVSTPKGTRISVKNLFYNIPVRRKFLKSITTELNHITEYTTKLALSHPNVNVILKHNNKTLITAPRGELLTKIVSIFGKSIAKACLAVKKSKNNYFIEGYITKPDFARKSKDFLYIFVNRRPISSKLITDAILEGYRTAIPHDRYPIVFLFLKIPPNEIDVNIHPTKKEIKFSNEAAVFSLVYEGVKEALQTAGIEVFRKTETPTIFPQKKFSSTFGDKLQNSQQKQKSLQTTGRGIERRYQRTHITTTVKQQPLKSFLGDFKRASQLEEKIEEDSTISIKVFGVIRNTYIIAETQDGLLLCDFHAAAEKINYVKYMNQIKRGKVSVQNLLVPATIELKPSEIELIRDIKEQLKNFGFEVEAFGNNELIIRTIPAILGRSVSHNLARDLIDIFKDKAPEIKSLEPANVDFIKDIVSLLSCRRAVKSGDKISEHEAEKILKDLFNLDDPFTCPHGRPTAVLLDDKYLEKLFKRDYR